jgi:hypothetical protein
VLFLLPAGAKNRDDEQAGDPQLRGVCGEVADRRLRDERLRGRGGWGKMMARGGKADGRRVCMVEENRKAKERMVD